MSQFIRVERRDSCLEIVLDRPDKKNAVLTDMYEAMTRALEESLRDPSISSVLFRGEGPAFCAGNDLKDFVQTPPTGPESPVMRFLATAARHPLPMIAAVHGAAVGIGTTLLLHCDFAYAATGTVFSMPFVPLGVVPEAGSSLLIPQRLGRRMASELLLLGRRFSPDEAKDAGLINSVHDPEAVLDVARATATKLGALPQRALRTSKQLILEAEATALHQAMDREGEAFVEALNGEEFHAAIRAFFKR